MYQPNGDMASTSNNNAEFADELDLPNLVDSDEPELRQLDEIDEKKNTVAKADVLSVILSKYGDDGIKLEECFRWVENCFRIESYVVTIFLNHSSLYKIEYKDLASLSDNDLKQFGVADGHKRRQILNDFSQMLNQNDHYDKWVILLWWDIVRESWKKNCLNFWRELEALNMEEYGIDGLNNIRKHLFYLKLAITGSLLKMKMHPPEDIYVSNELNASELVLKTLEEMKKTSNVMENQLLRLSSGKV